MKEKEYAPDWNFPGLEYHHPDCSLIKAQQLKVTIMAIWPSENGIFRIPYGFSIKPYRFTFVALTGKIFKDFWPSEFDGELKDMASPVIQWALRMISKESNGKIEFYEELDPSSSSRGIFFYKVSADQMLKISPSSEAFSTILLDNNGHINKAFVLFPDSPSFWKPLPMNASYIVGMDALARANISAQARTCHTNFHEDLHALGFSHLHEYPAIKANLEATPDGVYCSVMPYARKEIATPTSICNSVCDNSSQILNSTCNTSAIMNYCNPPFAVFPAQLDKELLRLAYQEPFPRCLNAPFNQYHYVLNALSAFSSSVLYSSEHQAISTFFSELAIKPKKPILSEKVAFLFADGTLLIINLTTELPLWISVVYSLAFATKYLPPKIMDSLPAPAKWLFTSNYSLVLMNCSIGYTQGQCPVPLLGTFAASLLGSVGGKYFGYGIGKLSVHLVNKMLQFIYLKYSSNSNGSNQTDAQDLQSSDIYLEENDIEEGGYSITRNLHSFFSPVKEFFQKKLVSENLENGNLLPTGKKNC